jgi:hypothetical protein
VRAGFLLLWLVGLFGLPYLPFDGSLSTSFVAVLDITLVFIIFKGDVRLTESFSCQLSAFVSSPRRGSKERRYVGTASTVVPASKSPGLRYLLGVPIDWTVGPTERFVILTVIDPYTIEQWRAAMLATFDNPAFREHRALLVDRRGTEPVTTPFVAAMTQFFVAHRDRIATRTAIVVADEAGFGMGRMTALKAEFGTPEMAIQTFRDYADAVRWLTD